MKSLSSLNPLFVFEMANNHMGSVDHGLRIIREFRRISMKFPFQFGFKLQYRYLDTFIHPEYRKRTEYKYVKRFSETSLTPDEYKRLQTEIKSLGFVSVCTPFDEASVDLVVEHGFDIIKIASCSFTDWPLLEKIVLTDKPIIASTAGATLEELDRTFSFFDHRNKDFAFLHCIAQYPTSIDELQLNQIDFFKNRYPRIPIGFSTHENPNEIEPIKVAISKGAQIFEKHVGLPESDYVLNSYSANPEETEKWLQAAADCLAICGIKNTRPKPDPREIESLHDLRRGVYAKRQIRPGEKLDLEDLRLCIPVFSGQLTANDLSKYIEFYSVTEIPENRPITFDHVRYSDMREFIYRIVDNVKTILVESNVVFPTKADFEVSHHYGLAQFYNYGSTMITVVNRDYCKKLIIMLPGQRHPEQYHKIKEETFHILHGDLRMLLDGKEVLCKRGDVVIVEQGIKHSFSSQSGAVIEEISSTHLQNDSFYTDPTITGNPSRKTLLTQWIM